MTLFTIKYRSMPSRKEVIVDTDPGVDDALALMLAIESGKFDIYAITTVAGNSTIDNTTRNARYVLNLLKRDDIPIYSGECKPLKRKLKESIVNGKGGLEGINPDISPNLTNNAVEKILSIVESNPYRITLVTLGPLTNIAKAILTCPETMKKVKEIVMMGGAIRVPGNQNRVAEFNMYVDPEAADIVFKFCPVKKTLVSLDACNNVRLDLKDFDKIKNPSIEKVIRDVTRPYIENISRQEGVKAAIMYDPSTIFYVMKPEECKVEKYDAKVETKGKLTRGMIVIERREKSKKKKNVYVVEYIPEENFKNDFIKYLSSLDTVLYSHSELFPTF